jgi:hypothetical protein
MVNAITISPDNLHVLVLAKLDQGPVAEWLKHRGHRWAADPHALTETEVRAVMAEVEARFGFQIRLRRSPPAPLKPGRIRVGIGTQIPLASEQPLPLDAVLHMIAAVMPPDPDPETGFLTNYAEIVQHFVGVDPETFWEAYQEAVRAARQDLVEMVERMYDSVFNYDAGMAEIPYSPEATQ